MPDDKSKSAATVTRFGDVPAFIRELTFADLSPDVVAHARRCVLDLIGTAAGGSRTAAAHSANHYATTQLRGSEHEARLLFDGRRAGAAGVAFAGAATIDSLDAHDGHVLTKGHTGVTVLPALLGFVDSGAPCDDREFIACVVLGSLTLERDDAVPYWGDLGSRWRIREQYFKAYPVCRWAQPAIEAALALNRAEAFTADDIEEIAIDSFAESVALGAGCAVPATTDEAQYSLPYPVAAALVFGEVGAAEVEMPKLADPGVRRLLSVMELTEDLEFSRRFPAERWARVRITLKDGRVLASEPAIARGNPENPLTDDEIRSKYRVLAEPVLGNERTARIEQAVAGLGRGSGTCAALLDDVLRGGGQG